MINYLLFWVLFRWPLLLNNLSLWSVYRIFHHDSWLLLLSLVIELLLKLMSKVKINLLHTSLRSWRIFSSTRRRRLDVGWLIKLRNHKVKFLISISILLNTWWRSLLNALLPCFNASATWPCSLRFRVDRALINNLNVVMVVIVNVDWGNFLSLNVDWGEAKFSCTRRFNHLTLVSDYTS